MAKSRKCHRTKRPLSSIQPLCSSQALWILDHQRISRCLQHVLLQWHPLQSRKRMSWRNLCNTQNHPCSSTYCTRLARQTLPWQPRLIMRLGLCQRLCRVHVAHPSSPQNPKTLSSQQVYSIAYVSLPNSPSIM